MWSLIIVILALAYFTTVICLSYHLGQYKTDSAKQAAVIGFFLAFLPPIALIYLVYLFFKEDVAIV